MMRSRWLVVLIVAACVAVVLSAMTLARVQTPALWIASLQNPQTDVAALIFSNVALPRILMSWIVGAGLALSGVILQQVLRNQIAEPATVGISGGAYLALAVTSLWFPSLLDGGQTFIALAGSAISAGLVLTISRRHRFAPTAVVIGGLTINLLFGAAGAVLTVLNHDYLGSLSIWQSGSLIQNGWGAARLLVPCLFACIIVLLLVLRPLSMLSLGEEMARSSGVKIGAVRVIGLALAAALAAFCFSAVGVIGFIGLMASQTARMMGARSFLQRLIWSALIGGLLLWLTDQCVQILQLRQEISTGAATAFMGSFCLLGIIFLRGSADVASIEPAGDGQYKERSSVLARSILPLFLLIFLAALAVGFGRSPNGWTWVSGDIIADVVQWRLPRVVAAGAAGTMLSVAGVLLQRMTGNPIASPEVLGISSGAALGVVALLLFVSGYSTGLSIAASATGALLSLCALLALARSRHTSSNGLLLAGVSLATLFGATSSILLTSGDPRAAILLTWMSGSTYRVDTTTACYALGVAITCIPLACLASRWLALLPLGDAAARSVGASIFRTRSTILIISGLLTGVATIIVGPLTFVGLVAPHMARRLGNRTPREEIISAAFIGGALLMAADWLGRNTVFPWQIPAGLVAAILGTPIFLVLTQNRRR